MVIGGLTIGPGETRRTLLFDPTTQKITARADLEVPRYGHTATLSPAGKVLVAGGWHGKPLAIVEEYDIAADRWTVRGKLRNERDNHVAGLLGTDHLLVAGGQQGSVVEAGFFLRGEPISSMEICSLSDGECLEAGSLSAPHAYATIATLPDSRQLVFGGFTEHPNAARFITQASPSFAMIGPAPAASPR